jgi:hypothetical protein
MPFNQPETVGTVTFQKIFNVNKSADQEGVYFCEVTIDYNNGFPPETDWYCARSDDYALTGKWVYQQIINGNFDGEVFLLQPYQDPITKEIVLPEQPVTTGTQEL